jgi:hypothetical protein
VISEGFLEGRLEEPKSPTDVGSACRTLFTISDAVRTLCKARAMPVGRMRHLQIVVGRIYHLLTKEAAYGPNLHHMDDFRAAQKLKKSLD